MGKHGRQNFFKVARQTEDLHTGLTETDRKEIAERLSQFLTDTYLLVIKSHICHCNAVGLHFHPIREMSEQQHDNRRELT